MESTKTASASSTTTNPATATSLSAMFRVLPVWLYVYLREGCEVDCDIKHLKVIVENGVIVQYHNGKTFSRYAVPAGFMTAWNPANKEFYIGDAASIGRLRKLIRCYDTVQETMMDFCQPIFRDSEDVGLDGDGE